MSKNSHLFYRQLENLGKCGHRSGLKVIDVFKRKGHHAFGSKCHVFLWVGLKRLEGVSDVGAI